ncbi:MAG: NADH-quinone oxidoreductase subunit M [Bryobacterales bacterium]|nr:NADH-quinone oxidoreductase subunit M [Bryobacterales bacterium]
MPSFVSENLLVPLIAVPFLGILAVVLARRDQWARYWAMASSLVSLALSLALWQAFDPAVSGMQFVRRAAWMPTFNVEFAVGLDGLSMLLVLLTTILTPLSVLASWSSITTKVKAYLSLILLAEGSMLLVFAAMDAFLFFMLWEVTMVPMYFMIVIWGGPKRIAAGLKFVLYSLTGSLLLLVGLLGLHMQAGGTFDIQAMAAATIEEGAQHWIFLALVLGFAIKLPMVPFHSWLPDAHSEAPTAGSVILAGILLKMGGYGFLRFCLPILPEVSAIYSKYILWASIVAILYGGCLALAQSDLKKLIAYSSISHMGFVTLGIFAFNEEGIQGSILQMFTHGVTTGALFLAAGLLYDRTHDRQIASYGGLHRPMPRFAVFFCIFCVASFGLPGTANFVGEFLVLVGTSYGSLLMVVLSMGGIVLAAGYMLWTFQRVVLGRPGNSIAASLPDMTRREIATLLPLAVIVLVVGVFPAPLVETMTATVAQIVERAGNVALLAVPGG